MPITSERNENDVDENAANKGVRWVELSDFVPLLVAGITAAGTIIGTMFGISLKNKHQAQRDKGQRRAEERDQQQAKIRAAQERADHYYDLYRLWENEYDYLRAWILKKNVLSLEQLARIPKPPDVRRRRNQNRRNHD